MIYYNFPQKFYRREAIYAQNEYGVSLYVFGGRNG